MDDLVERSAIDRIEARARFEGEVLARLTSIDSKIDSINATAATAATVATAAATTASLAATTANDHEVRVRSLEEIVNRSKGMSAAISAFTGLLVAVIGWVIQTKY